MPRRSLSSSIAPESQNVDALSLAGPDLSGHRSSVGTGLQAVVHERVKPPWLLQPAGLA